MGVAFQMACDMSIQRGIRRSLDMVYHHGEAVRCIRKQILETDHKMASIHIMATVATLIPFEIHSDLGIGTKEHMDGLEAMVNSRGGLDVVSEESSIGMALAWFIAWTDTMAAIFYNSPPRFKLLPSVKAFEPWETSEPFPVLAQRYEAKLIGLTNSKSQSRHLIELYYALKTTLPLPNGIAEKLALKGQMPQVILYKNRLECLERRAIELSQSNLDVKDDTLIFPMFGCASLVHIMLYMRVAKATRTLANIISSRMREMMKMVKMDSLQVQYPEMTLLMIVLGGLGSIGSLNEQWFVDTLSEVCGKSGLNGVVDVRLTLEGFLWIPEYHSPRTKDFWDEVSFPQDDRIFL